MQFANPTYLFALAGLVIPIAIHLWSRKEGRVVKIGSIKFLQDSDSKQTSRIYINELWLLLLRSLIIAVLVLVLSEPFYKTIAEEKASLVLIDPALKEHEKVLTALDTLQEYPVRWFVTGFPKTTETIEAESAGSYWHLIDDLNYEQASEVLIISTSKLQGIIGRRPEVNKPVSWVTINQTPETTPFYVEAVTDKDSLIVTKGSSNMAFTEFLKETFKLNDVRSTQSTVVLPNNEQVDLQQDTVYVAAERNEQFAIDYQYVLSAFETISEYANWPVKVVVQDDWQKPLDWSISWTTGIDSLNAKNWLIYRKDTLASELIQTGSTTNTFELTSRLDDETVVNGDFINALFKIIRDKKSDYKQKLVQNDQRIIADEQIQPDYKVGATSKSQVKPIDTLLWILLLLLIAGERTLAFIRNQ